MLRNELGDLILKNRFYIIVSVQRLTLTGANIKITSSYPRMQVIGVDFAGSLGDLGFWGEDALFIPEDFVMKKITPTPNGPVEIQDTLLSSDEPYFKFVLGTDYTFKNGIYLNLSI